MTLPELVIDLREEHELLSEIVVPVSGDDTYEVVNIPSRHIFANVDWVKKQTEKRPVWLLCASGRRSQAIKEQYFASNDGIKSSHGGLSFGFGDKPLGSSVDAAHITVVKGKGGFGIQQIMQLAFACMLSVIVILAFFNVRRDVMLAVGGLMIAAVLGQVFTRSCLLGKVVPKSVFVPK